MDQQRRGQPVGAEVVARAEAQVEFGPGVGATEGDEQIKKHVHDVIYIPDIAEPLSPMLTVVPLQLMAYYAALARGHDVDKPRNLAKSVTVE